MVFDSNSPCKYCGKNTEHYDTIPASECYCKECKKNPYGDILEYCWKCVRETFHNPNNNNCIKCGERTI